MVVKLTATSVCIPYYAGWSFGLTLPDGGPVPDGGYQVIYLGSGGLPDPLATATSTPGTGLIYNLDPSISNFFVVSAINPDAGATCPSDNAALGLTGRVFVGGDDVTIAPFLLP